MSVVAGLVTSSIYSREKRERSPDRDGEVTFLQDADRQAAYRLSP
jgi:hypothetical protein